MEPMERNKCIFCDRKATNAVYTPEEKNYCDEHFYQVYPEAKVSPWEFIQQTQDYIFNSVTKQ